MQKNPVVSYYHTFESRLGYRLLGGVKHFGYYPIGQEDLPTLKAQELMDEPLAQTLALSDGAKVLDAGCEEGGVALYLAKHHHLNVTGIDLLDFNIARARKRAAKDELETKVEFLKADYSNTTLPDSSFDAIYTMETLVHSPDYTKTLKEFHRLLKPGGKLVHFEYSMADKMPQDAKQALTRVNKLAAMPAFDQFTHGTLESALAKEGFKEVESRDITERMLPLLQKFERKARLPYQIARWLKQENHFANAMSAVEIYRHIKYFRYNIISAVLPK
ncbi:MAG TPA: methyltransferase domain-containing protein [Candidatus Saccharimonadia bacterium]|nr:methyltransferase domain-containing protein [Candidatus Saccharimonadia bacterium]